MTKEELLRKKLERITLAQEEAERLLEEKSRELYELNKSLERQVIDRTAQLKTARDQAVSANKAKSQFLANMSHEIRTPLNGMLGFIGLLEKSELTSVQREQLKVIGKSGRLLLSLISDILEFSKIEAGKLEIDNSKFHLKRCVEDIVDVMANEVFEKGLELPIYIDESIPKNLMGDEARIRQVLLNLIGNAVKFTPTGEISVKVYCKEVDPHGNHLISFSVKDTGVGIGKEQMKKIFSPFEQADVSDTRRYGGTGLGLTISKQIVEAMKGHLIVQSEESVGSEFIFTVPMKTPEGESPELSNRDFKFATEAIVLASSGNVRQNLLRRLTSWNITCSETESLNDIRWMTSQETNKVLLLDCRQAECSQALTILQELANNGVHILIMTAPGSSLSSSCINEIEAYTAIMKPVKREHLFDAIKLGKPRESSGSIHTEPYHEKNLEEVSEASSTSMHVLLVEDNMINQQVAIAMLAVHGITADVANNGEEATQMFDCEKHQLILMDCQMPVMDGFDATRMIRKSFPDVPIIAMTANAFKKTKEECFEAGMSDFLTKPVTDQTLYEMIQKHR